MRAPASPRQLEGIFSLLLSVFVACGPADAADLSKIEISWSSTRRTAASIFFMACSRAPTARKRTREQSIQRDHDVLICPISTVWERHGKSHPKYPRLPTLHSALMPSS